jgi:hypothetical protein
MAILKPGYKAVLAGANNVISHCSEPTSWKRQFRQHQEAGDTREATSVLARGDTTSIEDMREGIQSF